MINKKELINRLQASCEWLAFVAQIKDVNLPSDTKNSIGHKYDSWEGCIKGEYDHAKKYWDMYCPIWHTGQAIKALVMAYEILEDDYLIEAAIRGGEFIKNSAIQDTNNLDFGLIYAYEDSPDKINISAILESLDGLFYLFYKTGDAKWRDVALAAISWTSNNAYLGQGIFSDNYDPVIKQFNSPEYLSARGLKGRPLLDDAVFYQAYKQTGERRYLEIFVETANRLLKEEDPLGNWIIYPPNNPVRGDCHPRHSYWWGLPMLDVYRETGDDKYLDCAIRAGQWYEKAQRWDGGMFRATFRDFTTPSFGHATSGVACAIITWLEIQNTIGKTEMFSLAIEKGIKYCLMVQFLNTEDPNLKGSILEKVVPPPSNTDFSPYYIRDLGTIFFIQAVTKYLTIFEA